MRSVFFTKPKDLSLKLLEFLVNENEELLAIVLADKDRYRDTRFWWLAEKNGIPIIDFADCEGFFETVGDDIEMIWCSTFPKRIKQTWIDKATRAAVNFHAAPLPEYRGVFGFNFAFLNGDHEFGVTAHLLSDDFDTGDIIEVDRFPFDPEADSVRDLVAASESHIVELFKRVYGRYANGDAIEAIPQDPSRGAYYSRKLFEESKRILPTDADADVARKVRAFWYPPYEGAYIEIDERRYPVVTKDILNELG